MTRPRSILAVAAASIVLAACTSRSASSPASSVVTSPTGKIVFGQRPNDAEDPELPYMVNADGSEPHRLQVPGVHAVLSPDGRKIVTLTDRGPLTANLDGTGLVPLRNGSAIDFAGGEGCIWSPDAVRLLCQLTDRGSLDGLYSVRAADGGDLTRLTRSPFHDTTRALGECGGGDIPADFSPDGTRFVFIRKQCGSGPDPAANESAALFVADADGSDSHQITPYGPSPHGDSRAAWSPDGSEILYAGDCVLQTVHPDGTGATTIPIDGCAWNPEWSPEGSWIAFTLNEPVGSPDLFVSWPDGTHQTRLTNTPDSIERLASWGP